MAKTNEDIMIRVFNILTINVSPMRVSYISGAVESTKDFYGLDIFKNPRRSELDEHGCPGAFANLLKKEYGRYNLVRFKIKNGVYYYNPKVCKVSINPHDGTFSCEGIFNV